MVIHDVLPRKLNLSRYVGQWVVVCEDKIVAHNRDLVKLRKDIDNCKRAPTIAKIPKEEILIF